MWIQATYMVRSCFKCWKFKFIWMPVYQVWKASHRNLEFKITTCVKLQVRILSVSHTFVIDSKFQMVVRTGEQSQWYVFGPNGAIMKLLNNSTTHSQTPLDLNKEVTKYTSGILYWKKRGYPLWIPQSNMVLPIPYWAQGVHVGDVGIFTENGGFDFLFNICVPRDDPINPRRLPENFISIFPPVNPTNIRKFAEFTPGSYMASSSVAESRTDPSEGS